jgi:hypothetical protein
VDDRYTFDEPRGWHAFLSDAYRGGWHWDNPSSPTLGTARLYGYELRRTESGREVAVEVPRGTERTYLVPWQGEQPADFRRRRHLAFYANLAEPVIDAYADAVAPGVTRDLGDLGPYVTNLDGEGCRWAEHVSIVARQMAIHGAVAVIVEPPRANGATTREEEIAARVSVRARVVPPTAWAWARYDDEGLAEFAYADEPVVDESRQSQTVTIWRYTRDGWERHVVSLGSSQGVGEATLGTPLSSGPHAVPGRVPVVFAAHRRDPLSRVPSGRSLAATPAAIGRQVYQLLSQVEDTQRRAPPFLSVPTTARGGLEPEVDLRVGPGTALPAPEGAGSPSWVTFPPDSLTDLRTHCLFLIALAYRTAGLEVQADTSAQTQSGEALRVRSRDFEARAQQFARDLESYERRALQLVADILGVDLDTAVVTLAYPKRFVLDDPAEALAKATLLLTQVGDRIGQTGTVLAIRQAISAALALDDETLAKVVEQIEVEYTESEQEREGRPSQPPPAAEE